MEQVTTLDALNVRLQTWIDAEYNQRPHASLGGRTPLEVWEEDAELLRFLDDPRKLEEAFTAELRRTVLNDSTCRVHGKTYEVPTHLRRQRVRIRYSLLRPDLLYLQDGEVRVPLREVDPEANAQRPRRASTAAQTDETPRTGLNAVEDLLRRVARPLDGRRSEGEEECCA
jgi:hypothetical protein